MAKTGRPRIIKDADEMAKLWEEYKHYCNNFTVTKTEFSSKEGRFITDVINRPITATIEGFCVYIDISRSKFYQTYIDSNEDIFGDIVTRMKFESEQDVRSKFETETIPSKLAGLWMSRYENYNTKQDINVNGSMSVEDKALLEKINKRLEGEK
jgi:hypothetical protein